MATSELEKRMRTYEDVTKSTLVRHMPVIIHLDGQSFSKFTKGFQSPFDELLRDTMNQTMLYLCKNIQGCKFGYTQSDEISLLLTDYDNLDTSAWFDDEILKMASVSASMCTMKFNQLFVHSIVDMFHGIPTTKYERALEKAAYAGATFDSRVFNVPKGDVTNYFYWQQTDYIHNAIQMTGIHFFGRKNMSKVTTQQIIDRLDKEMWITYDKYYPAAYRRGVCAKRSDKSTWELDMNIPDFTRDNRSYIEEVI